VSLLKERKSFLLSQDVEKFARFVSFAGGVLRLNFNSGFPVQIVRNLNQFFADAGCGIRVEKSDERGDDTVREKQERLFREQLAEMSGNGILREALRVFKDSYVAKIEDGPNGQSARP
jgi:hypothetical protein